MSNSKHSNSPAEKAAQKVRTYRNQVKRYSKLLLANPNSPHAKKWEAQKAFFANSK